MKIALLGYGKMGRMIESMMEEFPDDIIGLQINSDNAGAINDEALKACDVAIDFSSPEAAPILIKMALEAGLPVVSGTTGWLDRKEEIEAFAQERNGAFLYASNFSIGVNILFALNRKLAQMMDRQGDYEIILEETHHTQKKDAPSGTAITLAGDILKNVKRKESWKLGRTDSPSELLILAHREEAVPGTHEVTYKGPVDQLSLRHEAFSRKGFAAGAVQAARWIIGKQGIFTMQDVLQL